MDNTSQLTIDVRGLTKSFNGKPAVDHIDLAVKKGEVFGFMGPNGGGKTTTMRMLCGLLTPDSGEGHCLGFDIIKESHQIKNCVGYMTQQFSLYEELTIRENLDFAARLYGVKNYKPVVQNTIISLGLEARTNQLVSTLSGGWKQRLSLSAALLHQPDLLLLDEPTAGVDPQARREFWEHIHYVSTQGVTTLVSTHYMDEAERCHRLAYMSMGKIFACGTKDEVINQSGLTTWQVINSDIADLIPKLKDLPGIEQVTTFGKIIHISGRNAPLLEKSIAPFMNDHFKWQKITPSLEDVFISIVGTSHGTKNL